MIHRFYQAINGWLIICRAMLLLKVMMCQNEVEDTYDSSRPTSNYFSSNCFWAVSSRKSRPYDLADSYCRRRAYDEFIMLEEKSRLLDCSVLWYISHVCENDFPHDARDCWHVEIFPTVYPIRTNKKFYNGAHVYPFSLHS